MINKKEITDAINILDKTYPNGWKCNDNTTDALTVILLCSIRKILR